MPVLHTAICILLKQALMYIYTFLSDFLNFGGNFVQSPPPKKILTKNNNKENKQTNKQTNKRTTSNRAAITRFIVIYYKEKQNLIFFIFNTMTPKQVLVKVLPVFRCTPDRLTSVIDLKKVQPKAAWGCRGKAGRTLIVTCFEAVVFKIKQIGLCCL